MREGNIEILTGWLIHKHGDVVGRVIKQIKKADELGGCNDNSGS